MRLLEPGEGMINSGHCCICEQGVDRHVQHITVDTLYDSELPAGNLMSGRKYVCQSCVYEVVRTCGMLRAAEVKDLQEKLTSFKTQYADLINRLYKDRDALVDTLALGTPSVPALDYVTVPKQSLDAEPPVAPKKGRPAKAPF